MAVQILEKQQRRSSSSFGAKKVTEKAATAGKKKKSFGSKKVPVKDLGSAMRQLATMISSGLTLVRALGVLAEQTPHEELRGIFVEVRDDVERGRSLTDATGKHPKVFGRLAIAMVRAGEAGGVLDTTLARLAQTLEKEAELRRKVKSAMTYPVAIGGLAMMIVVAMLLFVVPMFENLYAEMGGDAELPAPTKALIFAAGLLRSYMPVIILLTIGGVYAFRKWKATDKGRYAVDSFKLKLPLFGTLFSKTAQARFSRTLASMLRSGVPVLQALDICRETVNNAVMAGAVERVSRAVQEGSAMAPPMGREDVFPPMLVQMVSVGEETGAVDELCEKVAEHLSDEVDAMVSAMTSLIEPMLIAFLGIVIGGMVTSLYLPMFKLVEIVG